MGLATQRTTSMSLEFHKLSKQDMDTCNQTAEEQSGNKRNRSAENDEKLSTIKTRHVLTDEVNLSGFICDKFEFVLEL